VRERYRDARRFAVQFIDALAGVESAVRIDLLRRFHDATSGGKIRLIRSLA
jgi:hypothetical protein